MPHSLPNRLGSLARLVVLLALACLGCVSHRPADRRVTAGELQAIWLRDQHLSIITEVWYRGSTAAGDFFLVIEPGLSNPRERRCWIPTSESPVTKRFPLTDDRAQWRRHSPPGIEAALRPFQLPGPFQLPPATNDLLKQPLFTNRVGLIQP